MKDENFNKKIEILKEKLLNLDNLQRVNYPKTESLKERKARFSLKRDEEDHELKKRVANFLIGFLIIQTLIIFLFILFQGLEKVPLVSDPFSLDNYIFYILITGTIVENYLLVKIIVQHLFPQETKKSRS